MKVRSFCSAVALAGMLATGLIAFAPAAHAADTSGVIAKPCSGSVSVWFSYEDCSTGPSQPGVGAQVLVYFPNSNTSKSLVIVGTGVCPYDTANQGPYCVTLSDTESNTTLKASGYDNVWLCYGPFYSEQCVIKTVNY